MTKRSGCDSEARAAGIHTRTHTHTGRRAGPAKDQDGCSQGPGRGRTAHGQKGGPAAGGAAPDAPRDSRQPATQDRRWLITGMRRLTLSDWIGRW